MIKKSFSLQVIKHTEDLGSEIKKVAVCGGSGGFLLNAAIGQGADIFITSDYKYHEFFDADGKIVIADIGHYESEHFTKDLIQEIILQLWSSFPKYDANKSSSTWVYRIALNVSISFLRKGKTRQKIKGASYTNLKISPLSNSIKTLWFTAMQTEHTHS